MCTKEETAEVLRNEFNREGGFKDELVKDVVTTLKAMVFTYLVTGGAILLFTVIGAWFTLYYKVASQDVRITANTKLIDEGYTKDQAALIIQKNEELSNQVTDLKDTLEKLDDRLRAKGI